MAQKAPTETLTGEVERVNDSGLKLTGRGWLNYSKFAQITPPKEGVLVRLEVASGKFIQTLKVLDPEAEEAAVPFPADESFFGEPPPPRTSAPRPAPSQRPVADGVAVRTAALTAALTYLAGADQPDVDRVLQVAGRFAQYLADAR